jgi:hypothetical protein
MSGSPEFGALPTGLSGYAPADFADAEDMRPLGAVFDIGGHGSMTPYTTAMNSVLHKHMDEVRQATTSLLSTPTGWKKRLREFISQKNNDLLDYLKLTPQNHPTLGPGEVILRRFGSPQVGPQHHSVREFVLDASGATAAVIEDINTLIESTTGEKGLKGYVAQTKALYEEYRKAGDEVLSAQAGLKVRLDRLDRVQGKLAGLFEIDPNESYEPLLRATEEYLGKIYAENQIAEHYAATIAAYRRFAALRDAVLASRALLAQENEPICSICLQDPVVFAVSPCGHTYCQNCVRRQNNQCYMCRGPIKERVRLYFG